jgi:hypothetical protein
MTSQVYYQDGKVTITDKVIVTKEKTYQLSSIAGLSSVTQIRYIVISLMMGPLFAISVNYDVSSGLDPGFAVVVALVGLGTIYGIVSLFPTRKLMASLASGGRTVLVGRISKSRAQAIMYAFTLAKNA